jgi:hypothetical protein
MSIQDAINQLQAYQGQYTLTLHPGAGEELLTAVETTYSITLPDDFKALYSFSDGFETDEDMFNMIPLAEILRDKKKDIDCPLYIAEYMIYCDIWRLEINPDNSNDYKITAGWNNNQLVLTKSLAEFVDRFLKGGVFDPGGLYAWHDEIEALPIYSTKLKTARFLLTVFYYGLRYNLIHEKEVIDWVDRLIGHENEPDPFFIELSLAHDKNSLIDLLYPIVEPHSSLAARALLGILYQRLSAGAITVSDAVVVIDRHNFLELLTKAEAQEIHYITNETWMDESANGIVELGERMVKFLIGYQEFRIANYKDWFGLDSRIQYLFEEEEKRVINPTLEEQPKSRFNNELIINAMAYLLAFISVVVLITSYPRERSQTPIIDSRSVVYQSAQTYFKVFVFCYLLKNGVWLVKRISAAFQKQ